MVMALRRLTALARSEDASGLEDIEPADQLEAAHRKANSELLEALNSIDLNKLVALLRGPQGPWEAPAGGLLVQAITHGQHHRSQNASRMRQLGIC